LKIRLAKRHIDFLGSLALCGTQFHQTAIIRSTAVLGLLNSSFVEVEDLDQDFISFRDVDNRSVFFLLFHHMDEADNIREANIVYSQYCAGGIDLIIEFVTKARINPNEITVDDILDISQEMILSRRGED